MTGPRGRQWVTRFGTYQDATAQVAFQAAEGPGTIQRVWAQPNAAQVGSANPRLPIWYWGLSVGVAAANVRNPALDEDAWMVHRQVYIWNSMQHPRATASPSQLVDTQGQRVLEAGESLWMVLATVSAAQTCDFIWHTRVLLLDPV